jgi:hypothetical protein
MTTSGANIVYLPHSSVGTIKLTARSAEGVSEYSLVSHHPCRTCNVKVLQDKSNRKDQVALHEDVPPQNTIHSLIRYRGAYIAHTP